MRLGPLLLTLLTLLWSLPSFAEKQRVAVLELQGDLPQNILLLVSDEVRTGALDAFSGHADYSVMTRENMFTLLTDMGLDPEECMADANCEVDAGRNIGAAYVVSGQVTMVEGTLMMTLKLFATGSGDMLESERVNARSQTGLIEATKAASKKMVAEGLGLKRRVSYEVSEDGPTGESSMELGGEEMDFAELAAAAAAAEAEDQRVAAEQEAERQRLAAAQAAERKRVAEEKARLQAALEAERRHRLDASRQELLTQAAADFQAIRPLLDNEPSDRTRPVIEAFVARYGDAKVKVDDVSEAVDVPGVAEALVWLGRSVGSTSARANDDCPWESPIRDASATLTTVTVNGTTYQVRGFEARAAFSEILRACGQFSALKHFEEWRRLRRFTNGGSGVLIPVIIAVQVLGNMLANDERNAMVAALKGN